jgi:hypothetical protein
LTCRWQCGIDPYDAQHRIPQASGTRPTKIGFISKTRIRSADPFHALAHCQAQVKAPQTVITGPRSGQIRIGPPHDNAGKPAKPPGLQTGNP